MVCVGVGVSGVGHHSDDGAAQRRARQQAAPHQLHVAGRVDAEPRRGAGQQHRLVGQQQRETPRDLNAVIRHG